MSKTTNTLFSFLLGATAGAIIGILYAPDKGSNTRDKLTYRLDKYKVMLEELIDDILKGKQLPPSAAKSQGQKVIDDTKERAEQLLADVDNLIEHIKKEETEDTN